MAAAQGKPIVAAAFLLWTRLHFQSVESEETRAFMKVAILFVAVAAQWRRSPSPFP